MPLSMISLKVSLVIFMAGNLLDMGLRLNPQDAVRGLRNVRFVVHTLLWGFVLCPALAYGITLVIPLDHDYGMGLILIGMTPCAPFLPAIVSKGKGDLGFAAAFMLLTAVAMVVFMPLAVPWMLQGVTVRAWDIARPLLMVVVVPLAVGMTIRRASPPLASRLHPVVKKTTGVVAIVMGALCLAVYGRDLIGVRGSLAVCAQLLFFGIVTPLTYWLGFGLRHEQRIVLSTGMATRNIGAALAPLMSMAEKDQRTVVMIVLGFPIMVLFALLAAKWFGRTAFEARADSSARGVKGIFMKEGKR